MKKMIPLLLCLSMLLTVCAVTVPTAALNDSVNDSTWSEIELKALVYQEGKSFLLPRWQRVMRTMTAAGRKSASWTTRSARSARST